MKISKKFPKVSESDAFVIVAGKQNAVFYRIKNGMLERLQAFKIPTPRYSDNEGRFARRGKGMIMGAGSVREELDDQVIKEFLKELKKRVKEYPLDFSDLYLFVPGPQKNEVKNALPSEWQKKLSIEILGNYYYRPPTFLVEKMENSS